MPEAEGITTGWNRLDNWSQDLADAINDRYDECVTRRFRSDNPVAMGVADAANESTSGEIGDCPEPESGWSILDDWAGDVADRVNANHAECVSGKAQGNAKTPVLDSGWKRLDKWAAKIAGVIDSNHNECVRLKPSQDESDASEMGEQVGGEEGCPPPGSPTAISMSVHVEGTLVGCLGGPPERDFSGDGLIDAQPLTPWSVDETFGCVSKVNGTDCDAGGDCADLAPENATTFSAEVVLTRNSDGHWIVFYDCFSFTLCGCEPVEGITQSEDLGTSSPTGTSPTFTVIVGPVTWTITITFA